MAERKAGKKRRRRKKIVPSEAEAIEAIESSKEHAAGNQHPMEVRKLARFLYISTDISVKKLSEMIDVPMGTLFYWQKKDLWVKLRKEVRRLSLEDVIAQSRSAMANFYSDIHSSISGIVKSLETRLRCVDSDDKLTSEKQIIHLLLEALALKLKLVNSINKTAVGKEFSPDPKRLVDRANLPGIPVDNIDIGKARDLLSATGGRSAIAKRMLELEDPNLYPDVQEAINFLVEKLDLTSDSQDDRSNLLVEIVD